MHEKIVIVGSGHAGVNLAANLRKKNWIGSISLISDEKYLPYHRPPLSKICLQTHPFINPPLLKPDVFYKDNECFVHMKSTIPKKYRDELSILISKVEEKTINIK